ncbi:MAG: SRPBCC domain-containing protein [Nitrospirae bacterium]|jgi:hypothetical protein|nr:SRPBCC domain-containing protein [Nitrospirota bacterium]
MIIEESIIIKASIEKVWNTFIDIACWDRWNSVINNVKCNEKCMINGRNMRCTFRPFYFPINVNIFINEVKEKEKIVWTANKKGLKAYHEFLFTKNDGGVKVISREEFSGVLSAGSGLFLPVRKMKELTRKFLNDLKEAVEGGLK